MQRSSMANIYAYVKIKLFYKECAFKKAKYL